MWRRRSPPHDAAGSTTDPSTEHGRKTVAQGFLKPASDERSLAFYSLPKLS